MLALLAIAVVGYIKVLRPEFSDQRCLGGTLSGEQCGEGNGLAYKDSAPQPGDTPEQLRRRIKIAALSFQREVSWRRPMLVAIFSALLFFGIGFFLQPTRAWPTIGNVLLLTLVVFTTNYMCVCFTQYHFHSHPIKNMQESLRALKRL